MVGPVFKNFICAWLYHPVQQKSKSLSGKLVCQMAANRVPFMKTECYSITKNGAKESSVSEDSG